MIAIIYIYSDISIDSCKLHMIYEVKLSLSHTVAKSKSILLAQIVTGGGV